MDMVVADLERANTRAATVERRNVRNLLVMRSLIYIYPLGTLACGDRVPKDR